jgi:hypothetical protein
VAWIRSLLHKLPGRNEASHTTFFMVIVVFCGKAWSKLDRW